MTSKKEHEDTYNEIMKFYDLAEELVDTIEDKRNPNPTHQLEVVEPLIEEIEQSTDVIAEEYRKFVKKGAQKPNLLSKKRIETALRNMFLAVKKCQISASERVVGVKSALYTLTNALSSTLNKINKQINIVYTALKQRMQLDLKDYHYSRSGRQEGQSIGKNGNNNQSEN